MNDMEFAHIRVMSYPDVLKAAYIYGFQTIDGCSLKDRIALFDEHDASRTPAKYAIIGQYIVNIWEGWNTNSTLEYLDY